TLTFNGFNAVAFSNLESQSPLPAAATTTLGIGDGASHTATLTAGPGAGNDTVAFDGGLLSLVFPNPTTALNVNEDPGSDTLNVNALDAAFNAAVTVHGSTGAADVINLNTP